MYQCPIVYYTDNLIFNIDKSCHAVYRLGGFDYDFLDNEAKLVMLNKTARFLAGITSEAQILIIPTDEDDQEHFQKLRSKLKKEDPLYDVAVNHAQQTEAYLSDSFGNKNTNEYKYYIITRLGAPEDDIVKKISDGIQYFFRDPVNMVNVYMNLDTKDILESKLEANKKEAAKWLDAQNMKMRLIPASSMEVQWLIRRIPYRGLDIKVPLYYKNERMDPWEPGVDVKESGIEKILHPREREVVNLFSGTITTDKRMVICDNDHKKSYQTFFVLTHLPDVYEFPGMEWLYMLQKEDVKSEVCIHIRAEEHRTASRNVAKKKQEIESQMEHISSAKAEIPEDLMESKEYADALEMELKEYREPLMYSTVTICVAADNPELLEHRATKVRSIYEDKTFIIERPAADQLKLYMHTIPTVRSMVKDYVMPLMSMTLASSIIGAMHILGDDDGPYIGTTGKEKKHVFLNLGRACLLNMSAAATFYGNLGTGKSFNANLLLFLMVLYGGYGLVFDPKGERSHWQTDFKIFEGLISTVTLSPDKSNQGKLDPYNVYRDDLAMANELALNVISELLQIAPTSAEYTALLEAVGIMEQEAKNTQKLPSMQLLIEILSKFPEDDELYDKAKFLARRLKLQRKAGMSHLLIGDGSEDAITLDNRLNILQIQNLKLPSPEVAKADYTSEETLSTVLMMVLSHFAKKFALVKRPVFKVILFDESWMLGKTTEGVKLYDFLTRMGRSLYTGCIFNGHSVLDLPTEGIKNTISYKFCFRTNSDDEAARMCEYMGIEASERNKGVIKNLRNGECLFCDLDRRVGTLKFDAVFQDIIDIFSTTPKTEEDEEDTSVPNWDTPQQTEQMEENEESDVMTADDPADIDIKKLLEREV